MRVAAGSSLCGMPQAVLTTRLDVCVVAATSFGREGVGPDRENENYRFQRPVALYARHGRNQHHRWR